MLDLSIPAIGERMRTQDNRITSHPMFLVQRKRRIYGIDPDCDPLIAWLHSDESVEVDKESAEYMEHVFQERGEETEGYRRVGYAEEWEYVMCFFTEAAADDFIAHNAHRHDGELRTYVDSGHRNPEWQAVREHLLQEDVLARVIAARGKPENVEDWAHTLANDVAHLTD